MARGNRIDARSCAGGCRRQWQPAQRQPAAGARQPGPLQRRQRQRGVCLEEDKLVTAQMPACARPASRPVGHCKCSAAACRTVLRQLLLLHFRGINMLTRPRMHSATGSRAAHRSDGTGSDRRSVSNSLLC